MIVEIVSKNYDPSEKLKDIIAKKLEKLDRYFEDDTKVKVSLKQFNDNYSLELTIIIDGMCLRSEVFSDNMYNNIDAALPKLEKQIVKHHTRLISKSKKVRQKELPEQSKADAAGEKLRSVVRSKSYSLVPMTVDDAVEEMELVGHSFYVFFNKATSNVNVLYMRNDGDYGLIEALI